jgi:hypothetical protein
MTTNGISASNNAAIATRATDPVVAVQASQAASREPGLWSMLSKSERAFFLAPNGVEPLGYGRTGSTTAASPSIGQQLDVRG